MLRACATALEPGGRIAFLTIHVAPGLTAPDRSIAQQSGPAEVGTESEHSELLRRAGFDTIRAHDATSEFRTTLRGWTSEWARNEEGVVAVYGAEMYAQRQAERGGMLAAADRGLLARTLFTAVRAA